VLAQTFASFQPNLNMTTTDGAGPSREQAETYARQVKEKKETQYMAANP